MHQNACGDRSPPERAQKLTAVPSSCLEYMKRQEGVQWEGGKWKGRGWEGRGDGTKEVKNSDCEIVHVASHCLRRA